MITDELVEYFTELVRIQQDCLAEEREAEDAAEYDECVSLADCDLDEEDE
jgi:hypothetical protein